MRYFGTTRAIEQRMEKASLEPCKTDRQGNPTIAVNKYVRGFAIAVIVVSMLILILIFMPGYMEDSLIMLVLSIIAVFTIMFCLRLLLFKYTLSDDGLVYRSFTKQKFGYAEIKEMSKISLTRISTKSHTDELTLQIMGNIKIPYWIFAGSDEFVQKLEKKIGVKFKQQEESSADKLKQFLRVFIPLIILGVILYFARTY
ncbi:MAG: hypothetical protein FWD00_03175 [Clostridiales bacterium]|nr:hypothetical protein [Clostridiales bacterium]